MQHNLSALISRYGTDLATDARRCEALLRDTCPSHKREIFVLASAVSEGVPAALLHSSSAIPQDVLLSRLEKRLHDNLGIDDALARWAVESWAIALGMLSGAVCKAPNTYSVASPVPSENHGGSDSNHSSEELLRQIIRRVLSHGFVTDGDRAEVQNFCREKRIPKDVAVRLLTQVKTEMGLDAIENSPPHASLARTSSVSKTALPTPCQAVEMTDVLQDPRNFSGQTVRIGGVYRDNCTDDESFALGQGNHKLWVFYCQLPRHQQDFIMRKSEMTGKRLIVEGVLMFRHGEIELRATNVLFDVI